MHEESATKARLMKSAKREFLDKGFEKASLRKICADADVTTGAMYFFFKNKLDLFTSIVSEKAEHLLKLVERQTDSEVNGIGNSEEYQREMNEYLCSNKDEVRILLDKSEGTPFENFREKYGFAVAQGFYAFYDKSGGTEEYRDIMKLIVRMRVQGYIEMLKSLEEHYRLIIPAQDGFYDGSGDFTSFADQATIYKNVRLHLDFLKIQVYNNNTI